MASYVVMQPADGSDERTVLVRDRFSVLALIFPLFWLLWHRLWIEAFVVLAASLVLASLETVSALMLSIPFLSVLIGVYVALEGPALRIAALRRRGHADVGIVDGRDLAEAEIAWFHGRVQPQLPPPVPAQASGRERLPVLSGQGPALGLFDYPGGR